MTEQPTLYNSFAPLRNVVALTQLIERCDSRAHGLPGMAVFYGPSGFGKSTAAIFAANKYGALHIQVKSTWGARKICTSILSEAGVKPATTVADMQEQISEYLAVSDRPLLVDEADYLVSKRKIELIRDIHDGSNATVIMIGEEALPTRLKAWERIDGRIMSWVAAEPGTLADVAPLARIYAPGICVAEDLRRKILAASQGSIRRICTNLAHVNERARTRGVTEMNLETWGSGEFPSGIAPAPRRGLAASVNARGMT